MTKGTYEDFREALRAFESGWDRARYEAGIITDAQLDDWAALDGDTVETASVREFFPQYDSWGELTDAEWATMSYRSANSLGFIGYQFGEALLIDLGYYEDDVYYLGGDTKNRWDGTWTGKNGVDSLETFMTAEKQEVAIQEAFGFNLQIIETQLGYQGLSLDDFIGETFTYRDVDGSEVAVEISVTGLMAAAHLRGAFGTVNLLLGGGASTDENGTSILRYIETYGGYDGPTVSEAIAFYEDRRTGDEAGDTPPAPGGGDGGAPAEDGMADVTATTADVVITWSYGRDAIVDGFDPATGTIFVDWIAADALDVSEAAEGVVFAVPSNLQTTTLAGIALSDLSAANFTILDATAEAEILSVIGDAAADGEDGDGGAGDGSGGHGGMSGTMVQIEADMPAQVIDGFDPATDMIHVAPSVTADAFSIFGESGDALGQTLRIELINGAETRQVVFTGLALSDLTLGNFSIADQGVLNEVAAALGQTIAMPGDGGGYVLAYDSDGATPPDSTGTTDAGGLKYRADSNAGDIVGFDAARDEIDFGGTSVHGMIVTKSEAGEIVIDSPWSPAAQIVQGVTYQDVTIDSFGVVGNEHFRQDIGGVVSWELGIGPREAGTVYVRSHEYGVHEVVDGFDPASDTLSFLYFGTRERLSVEDTGAGLVISSMPTGQSLTLSGVALADLRPGRVEFHFDQVMEDNLEVPFGFDQDLVTLVDRSALLTPEAPAGARTDGFQTRTGDVDGDGVADGAENGGVDAPDAPDAPDVPDGPGDVVVLGDGADVVRLDWSYGATTTYAGFDPATDVIDFNTFSDTQLGVSEQGGDLLFEVLGNGGDFTVLSGLQAEDLGRDALTAPGWSGVLDTDSALIAQLVDLGLEIA